MALQSQNDAKKRHYPSFFFSDNVAQMVGNLEKSMEDEAQLLEKIANRISFSESLMALTHIDVPNGWLNVINIKDGGNIVEVIGNTTSMNDLKLYFSNIERYIFFKNDHVTIEKIENTPKDNYPDFQTFTISISKTANEKPNP